MKHTITYDANGGENAPEQQIKSYGQDLTLSTQLPIRESFDFEGTPIVINFKIK